MKLKTCLAIAALMAAPLLAHAQQQPPKAKKVTAADVERVVKAISADKEKAQAYCESAKLQDQLAEAADKKDEKKAEQLSATLEKLDAKLGPEWAQVMDGLQDIDPESAEGKKISATFEPLDKACQP